LDVYQFGKGISAGPALKYFTSFIGAGGPLLVEVDQRDGLSTPKKEAWDPGLKKFLGVEYLKIK